MDRAAVSALAAELNLPEVVTELLCRRGFGTVEPAKRYLRPRLEQLHEPHQMLGLEVGAARIARAIRDGEPMMVHGDYDVDGMCSAALLIRAIRAVGGRVTAFIPRRMEDGYDLTMAGVHAAIGAGARLLITCDCGTNAVEPVAAAMAAGIDVIITDHHLPSGPMPECLAVINPRQPGCPYPDKDLAAVGIAFKLALAVYRALGANDEPVRWMLDLVALATIADVVPLRGENRVLARYGLKVMADTRNVGLRALLRSAALEGRLLNAGRISFILAPRLNAVGRLGHALRGVELLTTDDERTANAIARDLEELNLRRQDIDRDILRQAQVKLESMDLDATVGIVLAERGWHAGVIGIVANRLVEELWRPVVLIALEGEEGKGSGRSIPAFDLHAGLAACRADLRRFGGHRMAAGLTIDAARVPDFAARFDAIAKERLSSADLTPELRVDLELPLRSATLDLEALLRHFEPFGAANATPVLVSRDVRVSGPPRVVGQGHLKLWLEADGARVEAIGFGMGTLASELAAGTALDVAYRLDRQTWDGEVRLQATLAALRR